MTTVWLGLGSNIGDRHSHITGALELLGTFISGLETAPLYETAPRDYVDQDDFLNTVARGISSMAPEELLREIQKVEREGGRDRNGVPLKGPRTIDIDILLYGDRIISRKGGNVPDLTVPHPSMHERLFVLKPLLDLDPELKDPRDGETWALKASHLLDQRVKLYGT